MATQEHQETTHKDVPTAGLVHDQASTKREIDPFAPRKGRTALTLAVIGSLVLGLAAGVYWSDAILHAIGVEQGGNAAGASAEKKLWTCGMHPQVIQDKPGMCPICGMTLEPMNSSATPGAAAASNVPKGAIHIDPVIVQNMGVRTAKVRTGAITRTVRATGYLQQPTTAQVDVNLRITGWVEKLYADTEGMRVKKGDKLFEVYSPEVQVAIEELQLAYRTGQKLPANADPLTRSTAESLTTAAKRKLRQWGLDDEQVEQFAKAEQPPRTIMFYSPADGEIAEKMVVQGAAVEMGERALRIVDRSKMWLDAQIFSMDLPLISVGQKVTATVEGITGGDIEGEISFIYPGIDPTTRTATARVVLENPELRLRPGMFATAQLPTELAKDTLIIPREAVLDTGVRQVVFVTAPEGHFAPKAVKLGASGSDGMVEVLSGLDRRDVVVTSGQFLMDSESRMKEAVAKHLEKGLMAPPQGHDHGASPAQTQEQSHAEHDATSVARNDSAPDKWNEAVDQSVSEYLKLAEALGAVQTSDTALDPEPLATATELLLKRGGDADQKAIADDLYKASRALTGKTLDEQRTAFKAVSDSMIELVSMTPAAQKLYVLHCPMAPGSWLQKTDQTANPYYPADMKECAIPKRQVAARE